VAARRFSARHAEVTDWLINDAHSIAVARPTACAPRHLIASSPFGFFCRPGRGFKEGPQRRDVTRALRAISRELGRRRLHAAAAAAVISTAKVPIVKTALFRVGDGGGGNGGGGNGAGAIKADISLGVRNGMQAVSWVQAQTQVRPLSVSHIIRAGLHIKSRPSDLARHKVQVSWRASATGMKRSASRMPCRHCSRLDLYRRRCASSSVTICLPLE
jgi:hypothetical protein